jgi:BirA family biotin operon repressor/biotin-[acetyl-CoA-carboxylase] ligase
LQGIARLHPASPSKLSIRCKISSVDQTNLEHRLAGLPLGPLRYYDQIGSTNAEALAWAAAGAPDLALVTADEQTAGRGRLGRRWYTPRGAALAFSLVLRPESEGQAAQFDGLSSARYAALGALAVGDALLSAYDLPAQIKWPNDVLVGGRKLCGVLVEAAWLGEQLAALVLGIGINVAPASIPLDSEVAFPATCLERILGKQVERGELLRAVLAALLAERARLDTPEFQQNWEERLAFRGQPVQVMGMRDVQEGVLLGLAADGALRLAVSGGEEIAVRSGDLSLRPLLTGDTETG